MDNCIFCKITSGEISSFDIYEDDVVKVFLDLNPVSRGHMLVVPKGHYENIFDCPEDVLSRMIKVSKKMSNICKEKLGASAVNIFNNSGKDANQEIFHIHFHIVPKYENDGLKLDFIGKKDINVDLEDLQKIITE
ncbi:MAG: HIT family protein [Patescibacteria group bacterium]